MKAIKLVSQKDRGKYSESFANQIDEIRELLTQGSYRRFFRCIDAICMTLLEKERKEIEGFIKNLEEKNKLVRYKKILIEIISILERNNFLTYDTLMDFRGKGFREK